MSRSYRWDFIFWAIAVPFVLSVMTPLRAQIYSPLFAPVTGTFLQFTCVIDGTTTPVPNATWSTGIGAYPGSNAHFHGTGPSGSTEPVSTLQPSSGVADGNGDFSFYLNSTLIGQAELFILECGGGPYSYYNYGVGYGDVYYNDHPNIWIKTGETTAHGSVSYNHYMQLYTPTTGPAWDLWDATYDYLSTHPGVTHVCTNDMALPFGGKFDIEATATIPKPWVSPHISHDRGTAADVAGPGSGSCPLANQVAVNDFIASCDRHHGSPGNSIEESYRNPITGVTTYHAHCNFANPNTCPH